ncbi:MAG: IS630 family transposase [Turicibacter sp.]|nr:IS630 family transposase [Turicibacter sp.]
MRDYQNLQRGWFLKGKQHKVPKYGKHEGEKLIGALDYETGKVVCTIEEQVTAVEFLAFLKDLILNKFNGKKLVIVLDNSKVHHARLLEEFLEENTDVLTLMFLPPYSPDLNIIEGLWGWMKSEVINNRFFGNIVQIKKAVLRFLRRIADVPESVVERLCLKI